jgi:hypothetical protein
MRKSSVRGIAVLRSDLYEILRRKKKKTACSAVFLDSVSDSVLLLREPAATPPPLGWNG